MNYHHRLAGFASLLMLLPVLVFMFGCAGKPPPEAQKVISDLRAAFNEGDENKYCDHFADAMYASGDTKGTFLGQIREMKREYGEWLSESYKGVKDENIYRWQIKFRYGTKEMQVIFDENFMIMQLYYKD